MNRDQKAQVIEELSARLAETPYILLADYRKVTVKEIDGIRREMEKNGLEYRVVKNTLAKRALEGTPRAGLGALLTGMTGMMIGSEDAITSAKTIRDLIKPFGKLEKFIVKGGYFDGDILDADGIQKVADLPGKEELLVMLLRTITEGPRQVLGVIQGPARDLVYLLKNYETKLSESEGGEG